MKRGLSIIVCTFLIAASSPALANRSQSLPLPEPLFATESSDSKPRGGLFSLLFKEKDKSTPVAVGMVIDERMNEAIRIAESSARSRSIKRCWRYVKRALQSANVIECYPKTRLAKQAAVELPVRYGFKRIPVANPFEAPVGAVLVYGGRGAGHVEIRTENGFVSDFASPDPSPRPLIGVFIKPSEKSGL